MKIQYFLLPIANHISEEGGYRAMMGKRQTVDIETAIKNDPRLLRREPREIIRGFEDAVGAMIHEAAVNGNICRIGDYLTAELHVKGRFDGVDSEFEPNKGHRLELVIKPGSVFKKVVSPLEPKNQIVPHKAHIDNIISLGAGEKTKSNRAVFGHNLSIAGKDLLLLDGDSLQWRVEIEKGSPISGVFEIETNSWSCLVAKWPQDIPRSAIGSKLRLKLYSRAGVPNIAPRTVVRNLLII